MQQMQSQPMQYKSREELEILAYNNPRAFLEMLEKNNQFRQNFQQLLQDFNHNDMIQLAMVFQGRVVREPVTLAPMLVDQMPKDFKTWMRDEQDYMSSNKFHELGSFSLFQEKQRAMEEMAEYHRQKAKEKKLENYYKEQQEKTHKVQEMNTYLEMETSARYKQLVNAFTGRNISAKETAAITKEMQKHDITSDMHAYFASKFDNATANAIIENVTKFRAVLLDENKTEEDKKEMYELAKRAFGINLSYEEWKKMIIELEYEKIAEQTQIARDYISNQNKNPKTKEAQEGKEAREKINRTVNHHLATSTNETNRALAEHKSKNKSEAKSVAIMAKSLHEAEHQGAKLYLKNNNNSMGDVYSVSNKMTEAEKEKHQINSSNDLNKTFNEIRT